MLKYITLSHRIDEKTPSYANQGGFKRMPISSIKEGRTANSEKWILNNHLGTHIDFPLHFSDNGKTSSDYEVFLVFNKIGIIILEKIPQPGSILLCSQIQNYLENIDKEIEVLLIKTNFEKYRGTPNYWENNFGFDPQIADYLRKNFINLKIFGFDSISLTSIKNRQIGAIAHQKFLLNDSPILIIEDMKLSSLNNKMIINKIIFSFFPVTKTDGVPVNCLLEAL